MIITLLQTKLYIPPTRTSIVPRPRLIEQLSNGLNGKLTLLSAPAGFGKTTLITDWLFQIERPEAWVSLDEDDSDPQQFFSYVAAAIRPFPDIQNSLTNLLQSPQPLPAKALAAALVNDLVPVSTPCLLILDDYHEIESTEIDLALAFVLDHMPPNLHIVITSRTDPGFPLSRLRARNQLTELRVRDLRFSVDETAVFLQNVMGIPLTPEQIAALETRTEGWVAGLQMAALSMQNRGDVAGFIDNFTGSHRFIMDYLVEEVLNQQSEEVQAFLLQTAVLSRLCADLCDAVTEKGAPIAAPQILTTLERHNIFLIPLDDDRHWYRYHHLFADLLRQRLRQTYPEQMPTLHSRASEWYEQNGFVNKAIEHALHAQDFERTANLAERAWPAMSVGMQSIKWLGWLKTLPDEFVRDRPVLSVCYAWAFLNSGNLEAAEARLRDAERWMEPTSGVNEDADALSTKRSPEQSRKMVVVDEEQFLALPVSLATARTYHAQAIGDVPSTMKYAQRLLDLLPEDEIQWRGAASSLLGLAQYASGNLEAAHWTFSNGLAGMPPLNRITGTFVLADIKMTLGQLHTVKSTYEQMLQLAIEYDEPMPLGTEDVYIGISKLHRERGDLEAATQALLTGKKLGEQIELPDWQHRWCIAQARLKETLGDLDDALDLLNDAERCYVRTPVPDVRPIAALKTQIWISQGRMAEALGWVREQGISVDDDLSFLREFEHITLVRMLIAQYKHDLADDSIHKALRLVDRLLQAAEEGGRIGSVIEILVQQALAHEAQGDTASALKSLEHALTLAEPEGYLRIFVDEGEPMAVLLRKMGKRPYITQLLAAFPTTPAHPLTSSLLDPLSGREIEILTLIAAGKKNKEIAAELFISNNTVLYHTKNLYSKLGVNKRTQAVAKAQELGLI